MVKVMGELYYFDGFPVDARKVGPDTGYDLCSVEAHGVVGDYSECWKHVIIPAS
jgi:hypothetical protein